MSIQGSTAPLRRVYVRSPVGADLGEWKAFGWRSEPDPARAADEHAAFRAEIERAGAEIVSGSSPVAGDPDAIYTYDPIFMTDAGAILLRPGKEGRRLEPDAMAHDLAAARVRIAGQIEPPATAEGGDLFWLDRSTLLAGRGYRTNDGGVEQLRALLGPEVDVIVFDLPHFHGADECLHLMSFVSPLDADLAVGYLPMMPVRLLEVLHDRGVRVVEVPDAEFGSMGSNVLAPAPRMALALEGNPETRRRMEAAGVDVRTYAGAEISRKGDGGPTCLTRPLERA
ncbi:MAG: dimethylarginine dimethylaminohydrolase family protein [Actinomycetota bacterium]